MREPIETGEIYHIYSRGVDKRQIALDKYDSDRFVAGLIEFNDSEEIGSIRNRQILTDLGRVKYTYKDPVVEIIAHCFNPNHFHLILKQLKDKGISLFLRSQVGGYARYFNKKYHRTGALFESRFKYKWIEDNEALKYKSVYVNLNNKVHRLPESVNYLVRSSWDEYVSGEWQISKPDSVLALFKDIDDYKKYAMESLAEMLEAKRLKKELEQIEYED